ncbi:universal stress protein [Thermococcus sp. Bubb.Bath]|uniref:universal stress protein n=1 Tax=Thermococcus sp. Bubb.Bath TaxID=1638242 RepID=UPI0014390C0A|nr:universal stress protein [Thermococcus sp. Bubb.Bath]NJF25218.1 universal stress protein [Thermococcus sp. Bubb.Bath]
MGLFSELIDRKFRNIAERRYEGILEKYREFFLTEEEMIIPEINSILLVFDRYSEKPTKEVYDAISAYPEAEVCLLYTVDENVAMLIAATLGEEEAKKFREAETSYGETFLDEVNGKLKELGFETRSRLIFGNKSEEAILREEKYDLFVISRKYGTETSKTSPVSPLVIKIVQHIEQPVMVY